MLAGELAALAVDFGRTRFKVVDRFRANRDAATDTVARESWALAYSAASYLRQLGNEAKHLAELNHHRLVQLGTVAMAVQRGAVSRSADGTPTTFGKAPISIDLGSMPIGLFATDGEPRSTVSTLELLGAQASWIEPQILAESFLGDHVSGATFLTRAVREGQTLTRVELANLETILADVDLSEDAESVVRFFVERGGVAWVPEEQIEIDGWAVTGYALETPETGVTGFFATYERYVPESAFEIIFHQPQDLDEITAPTDVIATIDTENLQSWSLGYRAVGEADVKVIATGSVPVTNAILGEFDPTLLLNGMYQLVLTGTDADGAPASAAITVVVDGQMKIGNFTLSFIDLAIPLSGLDIEIVRTYDSRDKRQGDFGVGWTLDIRQGSYKNNRPPGDGWQLVKPQGPFSLPCTQVVETKSHLTTVRLSDREVYRFALRLKNGVPSTGGGCFADAVFEYVDGPLPGSTLEILGESQVFWGTGTDRVIGVDSLEPFVPEQVKLTTRDGRIFHLDLEVGVTHLEDLNGNTLEITPEGITHSSGRGVEFVRDAEGRIERIVDPLGQELLYKRDLLGDLVSFTDRSGASTRFNYINDHYLDSAENALGISAVRVNYDQNGRMTALMDAAGNSYTFEHNIESRREVLINRLSHTRILEYDLRGNVVQEIDEDGNRTIRSFDGRGNLLSETDPLGHVSRYLYS